MAELPIMPVITADLLADTIGMDESEFGAYVRILLALWRHGGRLPYDTEELRKIAGAPQRRWVRIEKTVMRRLTIADGEVSQKRLTDVFLKTRETRVRRAAAAIKGNKVRWPKENYPGQILKPATWDKPLK
jgi:uncharacterized protein YdaU (DUF1376 family)